MRERKEKLKEIVQHPGRMSFETFSNEVVELAEFLTTQMRDHIYKENNILLPRRPGDHPD